MDSKLVVVCVWVDLCFVLGPSLSMTNDNGLCSAKAYSSPNMVIVMGSLGLGKALRIN